MIVGIRNAPTFGDLDPTAVLAPSRDELDGETDALAGNIQQLARDWFNSDSGDVSQDLLGRWDAFVQAVKAWDWSPRALSHLINSTWRDELLAYQQKYNALRAEFVAAGVSTSAPAFTFSAAPPSTLDKLTTAAGDSLGKATKPLTDGLKTIEYVGIGLAGLAVAWVFYLTYESGRTARSIAPLALRAR